MPNRPRSSSASASPSLGSRAGRPGGRPSGRPTFVRVELLRETGWGAVGQA